MRPIDPHQLLKAFEPLLTSTGGIRSAGVVPRLAMLMKKFSTKLVSRCTYCNVLLATEPIILDEFLNKSGWETLNLWLMQCKEDTNHPFLIDLLKLLLKCPMTIERLRENDTAKLVKSLTKSTNERISQEAKTLVKTWLQCVSVNKPDGKCHSPDQGLENVKKEKRNQESKNNSSKKKMKINGVEDSTKPIESNNGQNRLKETIVNGAREYEVKLEMKYSNVKIRLGKERSIGLLQPCKTGKINGRVIVNKRNSVVMSNKVPPFKEKVNENNEKISSVKTVEPNGNTSSSLSIPILTESTGFMDALASQTMIQVKKKRKLSSSLDTSIAETVETMKKIKNDQDSQNKEEKCSAQVVPCIDKEIEMQIEDDIKKSVGQSPPTQAVIGIRPKTSNSVNTTPCKSILLFGRRSDKKKNVTWKSESELNAVKFFESHDNERTNVARSPNSNTFTDMRGLDISREKEAIYLSRNPSSPPTPERLPIERKPWKLYLFDMPNDQPVDSVEVNSQERFIQRERQRATLQAFYPTRESIPDSPQEPDMEGTGLTVVQAKDIPQDATNATNHDYSDQPLPVPKCNNGKSFQTSRGYYNNTNKYR